MLSRDVEPDNTTEHMPIFFFPGGRILERGEEWAPSTKDIPAFEKNVMDTIDHGDTFVWFYGRMTYEDIFGNTQQTRFRWYWNGMAKCFMPNGGKPYNERT